MAPGPALAARLAAVDRSALNGHDLVLVLQARARQVAHDQAQLYADMAEIAHCPPCGPDSPVEREDGWVEFAADEIRAALTLTRRAAEFEMDLALRLRERVPAVWEALRAGAIDQRRARTIVHGTDHLPEPAAQAIAGEIIDRAPGMTTGQLSLALRRLCLEFDPDDATERYRRALDDRHVTVEANPDGTADLWGRNLRPERVAAIRERINHIARSLRSSDEPRTIDQLRADVFLDLLEGSHHTQRARHGVVDIQVDLPTLADLSDAPGEIPGWGPVIADVARQMVADDADAEWRVTVTDPDTGDVAWHGVTRRRPTAGQARQIRARHRSCVFPGCRMPAADCDLDHTEAWSEGGPTSAANLGPLCRHCHCVKHSPGWSLRREGRRFVWTSRLGHTYVTDGKPP